MRPCHGMIERPFQPAGHESRQKIATYRWRRRAVSRERSTQSRPSMDLVRLRPPGRRRSPGAAGAAFQPGFRFFMSRSDDREYLGERSGGRPQAMTCASHPWPAAGQISHEMMRQTERNAGWWSAECAAADLFQVFAPGDRIRLRMGLASHGVNKDFFKRWFNKLEAINRGHRRGFVQQFLGVPVRMKA